MTPIPALLLIATLLPAADTVIPGPWSVRAGLAISSDQVRALTRQEGSYLGGGLILPQRGIVGRMGFDVDWRAAWAGANRFDALSAVYIERKSIAEGTYAGLGAGASIVRLRQEQDTVATLRPTAKGVVGWVIPWKPPVHQGRVAVEAAGFLTDRVRGYQTHGLALALSLGF